MKNMSEAAKAARREYDRQWREKNRDKITKYQIEFWERKAKKIAAIEQERSCGNGYS